MNDFDLRYELFINLPEIIEQEQFRTSSSTPFMGFSVGDKITPEVLKNLPSENDFFPVKIVSIEHLFFEREGHDYHRITIETEIIKKKTKLKS